MQPTLKRFCTKLGKPCSVASVVEEPFGHSKKEYNKIGVLLGRKFRELRCSEFHKF